MPHPRPRRSLVVAIALALTSLSLSLAERAHATSCVPPELGSSSERAELIFVGTAGWSRPSHELTITWFRVEQVHKGGSPESVQVMGGGMTGARFEYGKRYLVFATMLHTERALNQLVFAELCGGTELASERADWIAALGPGAPPGKPGTPLIPGTPFVRYHGLPSTAGSPFVSPPTTPAASSTPSAIPPGASTPPPNLAAPNAVPTIEPIAVPTDAVPPPAAPVNTPRGGGCAGCATATRTSESPWAPWFGVAVALLATKRRRRACSTG